MMRKRKSDSVIEQVMDELNEESSSSLNTSPNLFSPELLNEPAKTASQEDVVLLERTGVSQEPALSEELLSKPINPPADEVFPPYKENMKQKKKSKKTTSISMPIDEVTPEDELSELENLLSFEPNRNKYAEEPKKVSTGQLESTKPVSTQKKSKKRLDLKEHVSGIFQPEIYAESFTRGLSKGGMPSQAVDPRISISLKHSENLRVAQERIMTLEEEIERLRKENEELISAGDIFRERLDKITVQNDNLKKSYEESREEFQEEKKTLMNTLRDQSQEMEKMSLKNKELEKRLSNNIQQIRVRERELENRLELMKLDSQTLVREKDQYILDLKRQIDRIKMDLETQKNRYTETEEKLKGQKSQTRRAARGLQMALHILRGNDFAVEEREPEKEE